MTEQATGTGPGPITADGCAVDLYALMPPHGEAELIHGAIAPGASILELGCGTGRITRGLLALGHPVTGVDFSAEMLAHMPAEARTVQAAIETLRLDERFDAVTLTSNMVSGTDEQCLAFLRTARAHLEPGGALVIERLHPRWGDAEQMRTIAAPRTRDGITGSLHDIEGDGTRISMTIRYQHEDGRVWTQHATMHARSDEALGALLGVAGFTLERPLDEGGDWLLARAVGQPAEPAPAAATHHPPATGPALIEAQGLTKRFGDRVAVDGIDFSVGRGEAFGFLGPNGAGKTTTMRMIGCVSPVSAGLLRVLGMDPAVDGPRIRARLGVVPQADTLDTELSVRDNLVIYSRYFDMPRREAGRRVDELLDFVQLGDRGNELVDLLSGGMKRRLTIARGLINDPDILLLDEPTTGLDPQARHLLWDRLYRLKQRGTTLVLTTHYMDEAEQLCDRIVIMDHARIVAGGTPRELIERWSTREVLELRFNADAQPQVDWSSLEALSERAEVLPDRVLLYTDDGERTSAAVHARGIVPASVLVRRSTLEDVFLRLTGRTLVD
jgi:lipooligosaccharide transport system ATP-binding protein